MTMKNDYMSNNCDHSIVSLLIINKMIISFVQDYIQICNSINHRSTLYKLILSFLIGRMNNFNEELNYIFCSKFKCNSTFYWNYLFYPSSSSLFVNTMNYCSIEIQTIVHCFTKKCFLQPVGWLSFIRHRETLLLVET